MTKGKKYIDQLKSTRFAMWRMLGQKISNTMFITTNKKMQRQMAQGRGDQGSRLRRIEERKGRNW